MGVALAVTLQRGRKGSCRGVVGPCFLAVAVAAVAGAPRTLGAPRMGEGGAGRALARDLRLVGLATSSLSGGRRRAARGGVRAALTLALVLRFAIWFAFIAARPDFRYVVYDYAGTLLGLLVFAAWLARHRRPGAAWIAAGVLVSLGGALVQRSGLGPSPSFNHNDLFHVIQAVGLYLYFRGGRRLADAGTAPAKAGHNSRATLGRRS